MPETENAAAQPHGPAGAPASEQAANAPDPTGTAERGALERKLENIGSLDNEERRAISGLEMRVRETEAGTPIVGEGDEPPACCVILDGVVHKYKLLGDGRRQIFAFHTRGDIPDLETLHIRRMDHGVAALTRCRLGFVAHDMLENLLNRFPRIRHLFWRDMIIEAAIFRQWMVGIGQRDAHQRIAHLLCEMAMRFKGAGLAAGHAYPMPFTQVELADALGLSSVHVNRVLRDLNMRRLVTMRSGTISVLDWERLKDLGEFDPAYLHQRTAQ